MELELYKLFLFLQRGWLCRSSGLHREIQNMDYHLPQRNKRMEFSYVF